MKFIVGVVIGLVIVPLLVVGYLASGFGPTAATDKPLPFETWIAGTALRKRIQKEAPVRDLSTMTTADLVAGADTQEELRRLPWPARQRLGHWCGNVPAGATALAAAEASSGISARSWTGRGARSWKTRGAGQGRTPSEWRLLACQKRHSFDGHAEFRKDAQRRPDVAGDSLFAAPPRLAARSKSCNAA